MIIIKTPQEIEEFKVAGSLSKAVLRRAGRMVRPGVTTREIDQVVESFIRLHGAVPGFKGLYGFPANICASINEEIVHGIPSNRVLEDGDILSIDTGAIVKGWVGDNAWTYPVGKISPQKKKLLEVTEKSMWAGISAARPGNHLGDIGAAVQEVAEAAGFGVVREYVGHGVGRVMHEEPNVPNYGRRGTGIILEAGMVIAIEPMINMGTYKTKQMRDGWTVKTRDGKPSAHFEKTIAITEDGPRLLTTEPGRDRPVND